MHYVIRHMLLPLIDNVCKTRINVIKAKGSDLIGLQNLLATDSLIGATKALGSLKAFHENLLKYPMPNVACVLLPDPADAEWSSITIRLRPVYVLRIDRREEVANFLEAYNRLRAKLV